MISTNLNKLIIWGALLIGFLVPGLVYAQSDRPDIAFDNANNRYFMVWSEDLGGGDIQILGKFLNRDGTDDGPAEFPLSPTRSTQGCFYQNFDSDNGDITTPTNCPLNSNPTVAYNDGKYLIVWEVHGTASSPASSPANQFVNIFARLVDSTNLMPSPGFEEGVLISKVFIAANNSESCGNGRFACNDSEIQAWGQSINPHVAPRINGGGFVVTWQTNKDFIGCVSEERRLASSVYGRYIGEDFSPTSTTNPNMFAIYKDDSTMEANCAPLSNVESVSVPVYPIMSLNMCVSVSLCVCLSVVCLFLVFV